MLKDMFGNDINVGDNILFGLSSAPHLRVGQVIKITQKLRGDRPVTRITVKYAGHRYSSRVSINADRQMLKLFESNMEALKRNGAIG